MARQRSQRAAIAAVLCALATPAGAAAAATNGAQPGTVAPGSATPTTSVPTATAPTGATTATSAAVTGPTGATAATGPTGATGPATVAPARTAPGVPTTLGAGRRRAHRSSRGLSGLDLVLAALGALLVLACLVWALARWLALEPRWATSMTYSLREASNHASATWAEFSDWARIGR